MGGGSDLLNLHAASGAIGHVSIFFCFYIVHVSLILSLLLALLSLFSFSLGDDTKLSTRADVSSIQGLQGYTLFFLFLLKKHKEANLMSIHNLCFEQKYEKYQNCYLKIFSFDDEIFNIFE